MKRSIFGYLEGESLRRGNLPRGDRHEQWSEAVLSADARAEAPEGETNRRPMVWFGLAAAAALGILVARLFGLQVLAGGYNLALANGNRIREQVVRAPRGIIYDRNGQVLASNVASYDVTVVPELLPTGVAVRTAEYAKLGSLVGLSGPVVQAKAEVTCRTHASDCLASPVPQLVESDVTHDQALLVDQDTTSLPGFTLDVNPVRQYSDGGLLSVILGYTGRVDAQDVAEHPDYGPTDLIGKLGLEKEYESVLRGINGGTETEVDASGRPIRVLASKDPVPGNNLVLSIDQNLEQHLVTAIQTQMQASGAIRAAGVAVDPRSGQVLAIASLPSYDDNLFSRGISQAAYNQLLDNPGQPLFDKAVDGGYPSGSIIKPLGATAALAEGIITPETIINDTGKIIVPNKYDPSNPATYYGWERTTGLGPLNVAQALAQSSDIFFYEVMGGFTTFTHYLGVDKLTDWYKRFGLGAQTGIDVPGEATGRVPTPAWKEAYSGQPWYTGDTYNISVGQGDLLVSPLQMVMAISAVANGGTLYQPELVSEITNVAGKIVKRIAPVVKQKDVAPASALATVKQGMELAVTEPQGTDCCYMKQQVPVAVAAKTGTAETVVHDTGSSSQSKPDAWFEAFAPADHPTIAIVVLVENSGEGADFAAPVGRDVLQWYFTQGPGAGQH